MFHNENRDGDYAMFCLEVDGMTQEEDMVELAKKYLKPLTICYDMGWQHHSLGSAYNSMSGHAFLIGANSNKILKQIVFFRKLLHMHKERMERPRVCCGNEGS